MEEWPVLQTDEIRSISKNIIFIEKYVRQGIFDSQVNNGLSSLFTPLVGVRQGCNLSPTLFNPFINDIIDLFDSSCDPLHMTECEISCLLYADDFILLS